MPTTDELYERLPGDLRARVRVRADGCWEALRANGLPYQASTCPVWGGRNGAMQFVEATLRAVGRWQQGWFVSRRLGCTRHCCNPAHVTLVKERRWRLGEVRPHSTAAQRAFGRESIMPRRLNETGFRP
jgi:hypothetical protein